MEWNSGSDASSGSDAVVVSPLYCTPHFVHLTFTKKAPGVKSGHLVVVVDAYGRLMYKVEGHHSWTIRDRMLLLDADGHTILLLQSQRRSSHAAYDAYRGDSRDAKDLLFSIWKASKHEVHVSLASNHKKHSVEFKVSGNVKKRTIGVYKGESTQLVAEMMSQEQVSSSMPADKKAFGVAVSPNVDSCFIAALFAVLPQIYASSAKSASKASKKSGDKKANSKESGSKKTSKKSGSDEDSETSESEEDSAKKASQDSRESGSSKVEIAVAGLEVAGGLIEVLAAILQGF